ncbi:MAG: hypothetical protein M1837_005548 [Sclerophora amabilis]|nr:MAG: hypothetical protein M1837_005548 [Sclerophora amabilis]
MDEGQYERLPPIEKLNDRVIRVLGGNPGKFTLQGTNTYILGTGVRRLLIDTGHGKPEWISSLQTVLSSESITIDTALITHWHPDHVGGIYDLVSLSPTTKVYKHTPWDDQLPIADGQRFAVEGATVTALHTPGHAHDHVCLLLEEEDALFTGDNVLGHGTSVFEDLRTYMQSLERMRGAFAGRAYPAHGQVIADGKAKVAEYIAHRMMREGQVLRVLRGDWPVIEGEEKGADGGKERGWTSMEITRAIYGGVPEELWAHAEKGIVEVLRKLEDEQRVVEDSESQRWSTARGGGGGAAAL